MEGSFSKQNARFVASDDTKKEVSTKRHVKETGLIAKQVEPMES